MKNALVSWRSGKDSAWTLHVLRQSGKYEIAGLLTTMNAAFDRVAMRGTRRELVEAQADSGCRGRSWQSVCECVRAEVEDAG
jgi:diphthamide synthase (EF-2-diphthine--ammonia ligase)